MEDNFYLVAIKYIVKVQAPSPEDAVNAAYEEFDIGNLTGCDVWEITEEEYMKEEEI